MIRSHVSVVSANMVLDSGDCQREAELSPIPIIAQRSYEPMATRKHEPEANANRGSIKWSCKANFLDF